MDNNLLLKTCFAVIFRLFYANSVSTINKGICITFPRGLFTAGKFFFDLLLLFKC